MKKLALNKSTIINLDTMSKVKGGAYTNFSTCCPKITDRPALCPAEPTDPLGTRNYC